MGDLPPGVDAVAKEAATDVVVEPPIGDGVEGLPEGPRGRLDRRRSLFVRRGALVSPCSRRRVEQKEIRAVGRKLLPAGEAPLFRVVACGDLRDRIGEALVVEKPTGELVPTRELERLNVVSFLPIKLGYAIQDFGEGRNTVDRCRCRVGHGKEGVALRCQKGV